MIDLSIPWYFEGWWSPPPQKLADSPIKQILDWLKIPRKPKKQSNNILVNNKKQRNISLCKLRNGLIAISHGRFGCVCFTCEMVPVVFRVRHMYIKQVQCYKYDTKALFVRSSKRTLEETLRRSTPTRFGYPSKTQTIKWFQLPWMGCCFEGAVGENLLGTFLGMLTTVVQIKSSFIPFFLTQSRRWKDNKLKGLLWARRRRKI